MRASVLARITAIGFLKAPRSGWKLKDFGLLTDRAIAAVRGKTGKVFNWQQAKAAWMAVTGAVVEKKPKKE